MELIEYPDEASDDYQTHPTLQAIMDVLDIQVPIAEIYERYLNQSIHTGLFWYLRISSCHMSVWYLILIVIHLINMI